MNNLRWIAVPALAGLASILSCRRAERPPAPPSVPPVAVRTARVGGGSEAGIDVPGTVEAAQAADIASRVSAVVDSVPVEEGAFVKAGELLVKLDGRDLMARLAAAEAGLQAATAQRDRIRELFTRDAATQQEKDATQAAFASALAERDATKAQIEYVELRAPFDGFIFNKRTRPGDLATPGQPLLTLQGAGLLRVVATVTRSQADRLKPGQPIAAVLEGGTAVPSRLSVLGSAGDPSSLRFLVKADLPSGSAARAGSFARLRLPRGDEEPAPLVPRAAIVERGALTGVYVVEDGRVRLRWISLGGPAGDLVLVRAGLSAGEEIVLDPGTIADGALVERRP
jgi:membrane fusion protein (multidrug efflux system)